MHATGVSETVVAQLEAPAFQGTPLTGDDSAWQTFAALQRQHGSESDDGTKIVWVRDAKPLVPKRLTMFTFRVDDASGQPATDLELYMGMPGHAVFVRRDRRVFAHVHPAGSAPMAALAIGQRGLAAANATRRRPTRTPPTRPRRRRRSRSRMAFRKPAITGSSCR